LHRYQELFQRLDTWLSKAEEALLRNPQAAQAPRDETKMVGFHGENRWKILGKCKGNLGKTLGTCEDPGKRWRTPDEHIRKPWEHVKI